MADIVDTIARCMTAPLPQHLPRVVQMPSREEQNARLDADIVRRDARVEGFDECATPLLTFTIADASTLQVALDNQLDALSAVAQNALTDEDREDAMRAVRTVSALLARIHAYLAGC